MKYQHWNMRAPAPRARRALEEAGLSSLCAAILSARGVDGPDQAALFLSSGPERFQDPFLLKDMDKAVARIRAAIDSRELICVYGDYDVDGITSTCLLTEALAGQGGRVTSYIPDRTEEGYGLNPGAIRRLAADGVRLIVTVDCGITAAPEVEFARSLGVDVVITDHHHCKDKLPAAEAVVDPRRDDCSYPFPELAGVGVALKTAQALVPPQEREQVFLRFGELAAIGTVADVMKLTDENRSLVRMGLDQLAHTSRPGLRALLREAGLDPGAVPTAVTIGYGLAPRINAAGRMEQAMVALELLRTRDEERGEALASTLCRLNRERQTIELDIYEQCVSLLESHLQPAAPAIVLAGEGWHQGVVGIVASRLAEKYACPAFMICLDHGQGKGSCRSFGGFNLFGALEQCAGLLEGYGGHEMAAGFTILEENIPAFREAVCRLVSLRTGGQPMEAANRPLLPAHHPPGGVLVRFGALRHGQPQAHVFAAGGHGVVLLRRGGRAAPENEASAGRRGAGRHFLLRQRRRLRRVRRGAAGRGVYPANQRVPGEPHRTAPAVRPAPRPHPGPAGAGAVSALEGGRGPVPVGGGPAVPLPAGFCPAVAVFGAQLCGRLDGGRTLPAAAGRAPARRAVLLWPDPGVPPCDGGPGAHSPGAGPASPVPPGE